jgi:hypothetical protein
MNKKNGLELVIATGIRLAKSADANTCLMGPAGNLLWSSDQWKVGKDGAGTGWGNALGWGWIEFIHPCDVRRVEEWLKFAGEEELVLFYSEHTEKRGEWIRVCLIKIILPGGLFYAVGKHRASDLAEIEALE